MAAFTGTPASGTTYALQIGNPSLKPEPADMWGVLRLAYFNYTHAAGAGTGEVNLCKLPSGSVRVLTHLSRYLTSQYAASADLHLGFRAYTEPDGDVVAEDDNAYADNVDVGGGAITIVAFNLPATGSVKYNVMKSTSATSGTHSGGGLHIYSMIDAGNIEDGDTLEGWVCFAN